MDKIYCGSGKIVSGKFGKIIKISLSTDDLAKIEQYKRDNNLNWVNLELKEKREPQQGKPTHYLVIDTWKPNDPF